MRSVEDFRCTVSKIIVMVYQIRTRKTIHLYYALVLYTTVARSFVWQRRYGRWAARSPSAAIRPATYKRVEGVMRSVETIADASSCPAFLLAVRGDRRTTGFSNPLPSCPHPALGSHDPNEPRHPSRSRGKSGHYGAGMIHACRHLCRDQAVSAAFKSDHPQGSARAPKWRARTPPVGGGNSGNLATGRRSLESHDKKQLPEQLPELPVGNCSRLVSI